MQDSIIFTPSSLAFTPFFLAHGVFLQAPEMRHAGPNEQLCSSKKFLATAHCLFFCPPTKTSPACLEVTTKTHLWISPSAHQPLGSLSQLLTSPLPLPAKRSMNVCLGHLSYSLFWMMKETLRIRSIRSSGNWALTNAVVNGLIVQPFLAVETSHLS